MAIANYTPLVTYYGDVQINAAGSNAKSVARRSDVSALSFISSIASGSQSLVSVTNGELSVESLLITDVTVDTTYTTLAAWVANGIPAGMKTGDILILSAANPSLSYICKVASPAAVGDFAHLNEGSTYSAGDGLELTGSVFSVDLKASNPGLVIASGELDVKIDAGGGIQSLAGGLEIKLDGSTLSKSANGVKVGQIANAEIANSAAIAQSKLALDITNSEINASAAIAQSKLALSITNSEINASAAIAQSKLALDIVNANINASAAIAQSKLALITGTDTQGDIPVMGSTVAANNDFLQVTADGSLRGRGRPDVLVELSGQANATFSFNSQKISNVLNPSAAQDAATKAYVDAQIPAVVRFESNNATLTANTAINFNHGLGKKVCHVAIMTTSDNKQVMAEVVYTDANNCTIKSTNTITVDVAISI